MAGALVEAAAREGIVQGTPECQGAKGPAGAQGRLRSSSASARVRPRLSTFETRTSAVTLRSAFDAAFVAKRATGHVLGGGAERRMGVWIAGEGARWLAEGTTSTRGDCIAADCSRTPAQRRG